MSFEKTESEVFDWSYNAYLQWHASQLEQNQKLPEKTQIINFAINCAIALAFILGFIGFIVFPQIFLPGLLLTGCLIAAQALSGFGIMATLVKVAHAIYEMGWKETLRMIFWLPKYHFTANGIQTTLLLLGILAIAALIILSATGVVYVPFLTVFAANALSLEILEILWGLVSDIAAVTVAVMACYLFSHVAKPLDEQQRGRVGDSNPNVIDEELVGTNTSDTTHSESKTHGFSSEEEKSEGYSDSEYGDHPFEKNTAKDNKPPSTEKNTERVEPCFPCNLL